nr:uncharacterized protein LOC125423780 [Ziziphus jujuba var. spinosa]
MGKWARIEAQGEETQVKAKGEIKGIGGHFEAGIKETGVENGKKPLGEAGTLWDARKCVKPCWLNDFVMPGGSSSEFTSGSPSPMADTIQIGNPRHTLDLPLADISWLFKTLKVDVPRFDGTIVENWIYKIEKFFSLHYVESWMEKGGALRTWDVFLHELRKRFGASIYDDPLGCISKLVQHDKVSQYCAEFEGLMTRITGVPEEILLVRPHDLADAMAKAQLFEDRNEDLFGCHRQEDYRTLESSPCGTSVYSSIGYQPSSQKLRDTSITYRYGSFQLGNFKFPLGPTIGTQPALQKPQDASLTYRAGSSQLGNSKLLIKPLTSIEIQEKREKGLCFTCNEKYHNNHKCKNRVMFMYVEDDDPVGPEVLAPANEADTEDDELEVNLNTLSNSVNACIFCLLAKHATETLEVTIDTGSNNNFIQEALVEKLGLKWEETRRFKVYMGNGQHLVYDKQCLGVQLEMQGHHFEVDLFVLPIWGLDVVLGMQWLRKLGPCLHDHNALTMEFDWKGQQVKLASDYHFTSRQVTFAQFSIMLLEGDVRGVYQLSTIPDSAVEEQQSSTDEIAFLEIALPAAGKGILQQFRKKDIMEALVKEMLECGFIRHSNSIYSSLVLLVKKKDGSWQFCLDYRALNGITIRDRFPILTIDELLDELEGQ